MNEERTGEFLQQVEHIHDHLLCRYSIAVNHGDDRKHDAFSDELF
jgi:hypothetical protein